MIRLATVGLVLALLVGVLLGSVLLGSGTRILSKEGTDLHAQFVHWREFGFGELRRGNLALWNPHIFCGMPYLGGFQSALLYPFNALYLVLPLPRAINAGIALHLWLCALFMYLWCAYRGLRPAASMLGACVAMLGGAHSMHIYAGHLPNLCSIAWVPLLFLTVDGMVDRPGIRWWAVGSLGVTMQVLAGHPQYVFYTAVACGLYAAVQLRGARYRMRTMGGLVAVWGMGAWLAAVQLLPGLAAAGESVRTGGLPYEFAGMFSFPPENLLTLLSPAFFGDMTGTPYWGRCYLWEMCLFMGVSALVLAVAALCGDVRRMRRFAGSMSVMLFVLALGRHTPLFRALYAVAPGFDRFRGSSKFVLQATLFIGMLAAVGYDRLLRKPALPWRAVSSLFLVALVLGVCAGGILLSSRAGLDSGWSGFMRWVERSNESYLPGAYYADVALVQSAGRNAARALGVCAVTLLALGGLLGCARRWPRYVFGVGVLALLELVSFFAHFRTSFDLSLTRYPELAALAEETDARTLNVVRPNVALSTRLGDIWGYDPGVSRRYAEFMTFTQGADPANVDQYVDFRRFDPLYAMLRCRYLLVPGQAGTELRDLGAGLPRLLLLDQYRVLRDRPAIFEAMRAPWFKPDEIVILESEPVPAPVPGQGVQPGSATIVDESTDHLTIEAQLDRPAILLVTDAYSRGWRARALPGSVQDVYTVMPANYVLRAIPLSAGRHRIRLEYRPVSFVVGAWLSGAGIVVLLLVCLGRWRARGRSVARRENG